MWTIERLTNLCIEYCGRAGVEFNSPVIINPRSRRRLGGCYRRLDWNGWVPTKIEFSKIFLSVASDEEVEKVVAHECAHYVTTALTHEDHGHDEIFRHYCAVIGTDNDGYYLILDSYAEHADKVYKYTFYCSKCGKFAGGRSRACTITQHPEWYKANCCQAPLNMIQNW